MHLTRGTTYTGFLCYLTAKETNITSHIQPRISLKSHDYQRGNIYTEGGRISQICDEYDFSNLQQLMTISRCTHFDTDIFGTIFKTRPVMDTIGIVSTLDFRTFTPARNIYPHCWARKKLHKVERGSRILHEYGAMASRYSSFLALSLFLALTKLAIRPVCRNRQKR